MKRINRTETNRAFMYKAIEIHGKKLIGAFQATDRNPVSLCKKLITIEKKLSRLFTDYCNTGEINESKVIKAVNKVHDLLPGIGGNLVINRDPRGHALKISEDKAKELNFEADWGGYGILAPDLSDRSNYVDTFARITKIEINGCRWFEARHGNTYHGVKVHIYYDGESLPSRTYKSEITYGYEQQYVETAVELLVDSFTVPDTFNVYRSDIVTYQAIDVNKEKELKSWLK